MKSHNHHLNKLKKFIDDLIIYKKRYLEIEKLELKYKAKEISREEFFIELIKIFESKLNFRKGAKGNKEALTNILNCITMVNEERWTNGEYQPELEPISKKLREIEIKNGLKDGEYYPRNNGPQEHINLNKLYEKILDEKEHALRIELLSPRVLTFFSYLITIIDKEHKRKLAKLVNNINKDLKTKKSDKHKNLQYLITFYEKQYKINKKAKAYFSASVMLGAALESLLLFILEKDPQKTSEKVKILFKQKQVRHNNLLNMGLNDLITSAHALGYIPIVVHEKQPIALIDWVPFMNDLRNLVHPAKIIKSNEEASLLILSKREIDFIFSIYRLIKIHNSV